ncbi:MAG: rhomboid family intramembrane serine protease [Treponema sp.]|nr:rhomboid family intramembrane serine protease [Treponema sp.]
MNDIPETNDVTGHVPFFRKPFRYSYFHATLCIILINFIIYFLCNFVENLVFYLALNVTLVLDRGMWWQFFTYMFAHYGFRHVFLNMLGLFFFGVGVERAIGSKEFLLFYFTTGILSAVLSFILYYFTGSYRTFLLGASGAVYAVLFAYAVCFPRSIIFIWGIIPVPAPILVLIYTIIEIVSGVFSTSNVAHYTHLFGFLVAFIYFIIRMGINPLKVWKKDYRR